MDADFSLIFSSLVLHLESMGLSTNLSNFFLHGEGAYVVNKNPNFDL